MSNFFIDKGKLRIIDTFRIYYFSISVFSFILTEVGRYIYRPFIYQNQINDFGIADSVGNWGGIIVQIFLGLSIINPNKKKGIRLIIFFVLGYVAYEIMQPILPKGVFDLQDVYGTLIGGAFSLSVFLLINWLFKNKILKTF